MDDVVTIYPIVTMLEFVEVRTDRTRICDNRNKALNYCVVSFRQFSSSILVRNIYCCNLVKHLDVFLRRREFANLATGQPDHGGGATKYVIKLN